MFIAKFTTLDSFLLFAFLSLVLCGCPPQKRLVPPPPPQPEILVVLQEGAEQNVVIEVQYLNHDRNRAFDNNPSFVIIKDLPTLKHYKKQATFLLSQLEEAEKRMQVKEQLPRKDDVK